MIRTAFFDLGNVLLFFSFEKMFHALENATSLSKEALQELFFTQNLHARFEKGKISGEKLFEIVSSQGNTGSFHAFRRALSDIFVPNYDAWKIVETLKKNQIELILLSNTNEFHFRFVEENFPSLITLFDQKVLSFQVGAMKPEKEIFEIALKTASSPIKECFYTDDVEENIESAKTLGLDSELFLNAQDLRDKLKKRGLPL